MEKRNPYFQDLQRLYLLVLEKELNSQRLAVQQMEDNTAELYAVIDKVFADNDKKYSAVIARLTERLDDAKAQLEQLCEERDKVIMVLEGIR
jgi:glucose-6-phosphate isomerase